MVLGLSAPEIFFVILPILVIRVLPWVLLVIVAVLAIRWLLRQERANKDPERVAIRGSLGEVIAAHRKDCKMTQEFVAGELGVSRQAVSKWESGASEPSTTNLVALARLFGMEAADLLREVDG